MNPTVMLVDDRQENLLLLERILKSHYDTIKFGSGDEAVSHLLAAKWLPHLILLDIMMPGLDGLGVLRILKNHSKLRHIPVICVTASDSELSALSLGAADYIDVPFNPEIVHVRVAHQILLQRHIDDLEGLVAEKTKEALDARDNVLLVMADMIEYRHVESGSHVKRVAKYTKALLDALADHPIYGPQIEEIGADVIVKAVPLHDVGKIGIPDNILLKPGRLLPEEYEVMKTHTTLGKVIVDSVLRTGRDDTEFLRHCSEIAHCHHEWFNGEGYPRRLAGEEIPLAARIMAVADVYDALVTRRVYKGALLHRQALEAIGREAGTHFDPVVVDALFRCAPVCAAITDHTTDGARRSGTVTSAAFVGGGAPPPTGGPPA